VAHWIKLVYDRNTYVIDLDRVGAFCHMQNGCISFTVLDGITTIVINQQNNLATYHAILDYVEKKTGHTL
jgi:hypothetical protein